MDKVVWAGQLEQDSRTAGTGQLGQDSPPPGQDISDRTSGTGHWERTAETGQAGQVGLNGTGNLNRAART